MMMVMQWLALCFATIFHAQSNKIPLYVGSMAPLSGKRSWWGAGITAAMKMAFEYINNRTDILPSYKLTLLANDTKVRCCRFLLTLNKISGILIACGQ